MTTEYALRVTRRALADIDLKMLAGPKFDLEANKHRHAMLEAFVQKRGKEPIGQEQTLGIKAPVYNLHARNPWRGVTWYDEETNACWLLGVTAHDYNEFVARAKVGDLTPTVDDYADLEAARSVVPPAADEASVLAAIAEEGQALVASAFETPNTEVLGTLAEAVDVGVLAEVIFSLADGADLYIGFKLPPRPGVNIPDSLVQVAAAAMLPNADVAQIDWWVDDFPGRTPAPGEWVVRWRRPAD